MSAGTEAGSEGGEPVPWGRTDGGTGGGRGGAGGAPAVVARGALRVSSIRSPSTLPAGGCAHAKGEIGAIHLAILVLVRRSGITEALAGGGVQGTGDGIAVLTQGEDHVDAGARQGHGHRLR